MYLQFCDEHVAKTKIRCRTLSSHLCSTIQTPSSFTMWLLSASPTVEWLRWLILHVHQISSKQWLASRRGLGSLSGMFLVSSTSAGSTTNNISSARVSLRPLWSWRSRQRIATTWNLSTISVGRARHRVRYAFPFPSYTYSSLENRNYLTSVVGTRSHYPLKRPIFSCDVAVQTESTVVGYSPQPQALYGQAKIDSAEEQEISTLMASDLASILKWSKDISSDINLSSGWSASALWCIASDHCLALQRLTEIATGNSMQQIDSYALLIPLLSIYRNIWISEHMRCYSQGSRRLHCCYEYGPSRSLSSARVGWVLFNDSCWLKFPQKSQVDTNHQRPVTESNYSARFVDDNFMSHFPSLTLTFSSEHEGTRLLWWRVLRLAILIRSRSKSSSICDMSTYLQQSWPNLWCCLFCVQIRVLSKHIDHLDTSLPTSQH